VGSPKTSHRKSEGHYRFTSPLHTLLGFTHALSHSAGVLMYHYCSVNHSSSSSFLKDNGSDVLELYQRIITTISVFCLDNVPAVDKQHGSFSIYNVVEESLS